MSSISGPYPNWASFNQAIQNVEIHNDNPRHNPLGPSEGNDTLHFGPSEGDDILPTGEGHNVLQATAQRLPVNDDPMPGQHAQHRIDNDNPLINALDQNAGDEAEVFDLATQTWQPTQSAGNGQHTSLGDPYREAIDFEIVSDNMGGWQRA